MKLLAKGNSMMPTLVDSHFYKMVKIENGQVSKGDIIVYKVKDLLICHRVIDVVVLKSGRRFYKAKGDNCCDADPYAITIEMIIGKVIV